MSDTDVCFEFHKLQITNAIYEMITECFEKIGFRPTSWWQLDKPEKWGQIIHRYTDNGLEYVSWAERNRELKEGDDLYFRYSPREKSDLIFEVQFLFSGSMVVDYIYIRSSSVRAFLREYDYHEADLVQRFQSLSKELYERLMPIKTIGEQDENEEPWFYFSEDNWKEIGELPLEECTQPHLRIWAKHPGKILDWDYFKDEDIYPHSKTWEPKVPIEFNSKFQEFHLFYIDESSRRRISLLRNCPCCGGLFPKSERDDLFGKATEDEVKKFREIAWHAKDVSELIESLGKPDIELGAVTYGEGKKEINEDIKAQICYTRLSNNVVVIFKEYETGIIVVNYAGKLLANE